MARKKLHNSFALSRSAALTALLVSFSSIGLTIHDMETKPQRHGENIKDFRTGRHVLFDLRAHIVLLTKHRHGVITDRVRDALELMIREICERHGAAVETIDSGEDYVHFLASYPSKLSISTLVGAIKTNTSREIRALDFPEVHTRRWADRFWASSYAAISTGAGEIEAVNNYIKEQRRPGRVAGRPRR